MYIYMLSLLDIMLQHGGELSLVLDYPSFLAGIIKSSKLYILYI